METDVPREDGVWIGRNKGTQEMRKKSTEYEKAGKKDAGETKRYILPLTSLLLLRKNATEVGIYL